MARYLFRRVVHWGRSSNVFLENGARLYLDVGSHPEYATPECDGMTDLVAHDKAGERILEALLAAAEVRLHDEGISGDVFLFKNNTDSAGNSYGCHENYLVARQGEFARIADVLIPFFVTRQIYCGAGKVLHGPRGAQFCISQRAEHIWEGVSSATTRSRPIINTRDEPHADAERFRRLHVIVGDSNMSEFTTFLKVGVTDLVVRMVEENTVMRDLTLENPIRAIREISPRHLVPASRSGWRRAASCPPIDIQTGVLRSRGRGSSSAAAPTRPPSGSSPNGASALEALRDGGARAAGDEGRLGREARPARALPREARLAALASRGSRSWTSRTTT